MHNIANNVAEDKTRASRKIALTRAQFPVWGHMVGNHYTPYDEPEFRQAGPGEVVEQGGEFWQLIFNGRSFVGNRPVSDLVAKYQASIILEAQLSAALAGLKTFGFGDELIDRFVEAL